MHPVEQYSLLSTPAAIFLAVGRMRLQQVLLAANGMADGDVHYLAELVLVWAIVCYKPVRTVKNKCECGIEITCVP